MLLSKENVPFSISANWYVMVESGLAEKFLTKTYGTHLGVSLSPMIASSCFLPQCLLPRSTVTALSWVFLWKWVQFCAKFDLISLETAAEGLILFSLFPLGFFLNIASHLLLYFLWLKKHFSNRLDFRSIQLSSMKTAPSGCFVCSSWVTPPALSLVRQFSPL